MNVVVDHGFLPPYIEREASKTVGQKYKVLRNGIVIVIVIINEKMIITACQSANIKNNNAARQTDIILATENVTAVKFS